VTCTPDIYTRYIGTHLSTSRIHVALVTACTRNVYLTHSWSASIGRPSSSQASLKVSILFLRVAGKTKTTPQLFLPPEQSSLTPPRRLRVHNAVRHAARSITREKSASIRRSATRKRGVPEKVPVSVRDKFLHPPSDRHVLPEQSLCQRGSGREFLRSSAHVSSSVVRDRQLVEAVSRCVHKVRARLQQPARWAHAIVTLTPFTTVRDRPASDTILPAAEAESCRP
jgi:hypothetical protein